MPDGTHIAVAVDTERGLFTPVIRNADLLPLGQLSGNLTSLIERARMVQLAMDEVQGGTFTISNLGQYAVDGFTPIVNLPQSTILGIGRICREPAVVNEETLIRDQVAFSLTFDHRVNDGAVAASFLSTVSTIIGHPLQWLVL